MTEAPPEVGLDDDQDRRRADDHQSAEEPGVRHLLAALLGEVRREHQQGRELRHLGGLEVERAEVEGDLVLPRGDAEQEQQREEHEREPVEEGGALLPPLVVERHDDRHDDHRHDREDRPGG